MYWPPASTECFREVPILTYRSHRIKIPLIVDAIQTFGVVIQILRRNAKLGHNEGRGGIFLL